MCSNAVRLHRAILQKSIISDFRFLINFIWLQLNLNQMSEENIAHYVYLIIDFEDKVSVCCLTNKTNKVPAIPVFSINHINTHIMYTYSFHQQNLYRSVIFEIVTWTPKHKIHHYLFMMRDSLPTLQPARENRLDVTERLCSSLTHSPCLLLDFIAHKTPKHEAQWRDVWVWRQSNARVGLRGPLAAGTGDGTD